MRGLASGRSWRSVDCCTISVAPNASSRYSQPMTDAATPTEELGPTMNRIYNDLLVRWARSTGEAQTPECEECGRDMTAHAVIEGRFGWYCSRKCAHEASSGCSIADEREDFHADI